MVSTNQNRCLDMLMVADGILSCLKEHRERSGVDLHCRIGIATGDVISGVLGLLQPRFCVFGEAMCRAEELEQTGVKDAAHCSSEFLDYINHDQTGTAQGLLQKRRASFNADLLFEYQNTRKTLITTDQQESKVLQKRKPIVTRMINEGKLYEQQNMMTAEPSAHVEFVGQVQRMRSPSSFGRQGAMGISELFPSINAYGNFESWYGDVAFLRSIDQYGMILMRENSSSKVVNVPEKRLPEGKIA